MFTSSSCCDHFLTEFLYLYSFSSLVVCVMIARYLLLLFLSILFYYYLNAFISCIRVVLYLFLPLFPIESLLMCFLLYFAVIISCVRFIPLLTSFTFHIGSLQLCLVLYFALIVSYVCFILWLNSGTYFFHFSHWVPSVVPSSLLCCDHQLRVLHSLIEFRYLLLPLFPTESHQLCLVLYFAAIIILWLNSGTYFFHFFLLSPFSCA